MWGSVGWGLLTVIAGFLVDQGSQQGTKDYTPAFVLLASLLLLDLLMTGLSLEMSSPDTQARMVLSEAVRLLGTVRVVIFVVWCVLCGVLQSLYWNWLPWYLSDLAASSQNTQDWLTLLIGINMGVQCFVGEVPMFFLSGWLIGKLGHSNTMTLVLGAFGLRSLLYSLLTNPWYSLPIEVLNGVTFGIFYATMTSYANILSPPGNVLILSYEVIIHRVLQATRTQCKELSELHSRASALPSEPWSEEPSTKPSTAGGCSEYLVCWPSSSVWFMQF